MSDIDYALGELETSNTKLAAALTAVGIPLRKNNPVKIITGDSGEKRCFFFAPVSPCGMYKTHELIRAWNDPEWHLKNPEHPFAYVKVAFDNFERLRDYIKQGVPTVCVKKGHKFAFLSLNAPDSLQQQVFSRLNRR